MAILDTLHRAAIRNAFALWYGWRPYGRYAAALEKSQWLPWPEIQDLQMNKLRLLLNHAYNSVPFYRKRFKLVGLRPGDIQTPEDMRRLPVLTKKDIQDNFNEVLATGLHRHRLIKNSTGGSTGHPLTFYQDANFETWRLADHLRSYRLAGYELGMPWAFLWGSHFDSREHQGLYGFLKDRLIYNLLWINAFNFTRETLARAAEKLRVWQPEMLVAYVSPATLLARFMKDQGLAGFRFKSMQTSAEVLTPEDRRLLEETFGCRVFDRYGSREMGNIAHECEAHQGLHILTENNLVEVLDEEGNPVKPGDLGRIVVTNLNNYAMPFIRYDIGDLGRVAAESCACGRGLPLLKAVVGRSCDTIVSPSGKFVYGGFFTYHFKSLGGIQQFRVIQETPAELLIEIVPGPQFDQERTLARITELVHLHCDPVFHIRFKISDEPLSSPSGKHRFTISHVPVDFRKP